MFKRLLQTGPQMRWAMVALACFAGAISLYSAEEPFSPVFGEPPAKRFRIGPFYETRTEKDGTVSTMIRPFFSTLRNAENTARITETVWPLTRWVSNDNRRYGRVLNFSYSTDDVTDDDSVYSRIFFPFYAEGRTREGEDYWALFPFYGHMPTFLVLAHDVDFIMFPFYCAYTTGGASAIRTRYYLFPFISTQTDHYDRNAEEQRIDRWGFWPFYGSKSDGLVESNYVLWPFWVHAIYDSPMRQGDAWLAFPFYGRVITNSEDSRMFIPPFIRYTKGEKQGMLRVWPFYEDSWDTQQAYTSYWPFYGSRKYDEWSSWYSVWPLGAGMTRTDKKSKTEVTFSRFFPFYFRETRTRVDADGTRTKEFEYLRIWPFYSRQKKADGSHYLRTLELFPLRDSPSFERTFVPFWTLYEFQRYEDGSTDNYLLWGLLNW